MLCQRLRTCGLPREKHCCMNRYVDRRWVDERTLCVVQLSAVSDNGTLFSLVSLSSSVFRLCLAFGNKD
jgi:hypothetical protein